MAQNWFILRGERESSDRVHEMLEEWSRAGGASAGSDRRRICWPGPGIVADLVENTQMLKYSNTAPRTPIGSGVGSWGLINAGTCCQKFIDQTCESCSNTSNECGEWGHLHVLGPQCLEAVAGEGLGSVASSGRGRGRPSF